MSKVRKWMIEERGVRDEKIVMPDTAIKLFGKTIPLPLYLNPNTDVNTEKAMNATYISRKEPKFFNAPISFQEEETQFPPSSQEDEILPSLADEARSSSSSNSGCEEYKQGESSAPDELLTAPQLLDTKPASESREVQEKIKSDEDPQSTVSEERARRRPDKAVPCPRCESMDTKFCYYNNYNLNQPRHFCKNCQRYWTAGGSLRNVPVGAGRRKNKHAYAQHWHVLPSMTADPVEVAQQLISCAYPQTVNFPLDLLQSASKIGLPPVFTQDVCSLLSTSSDSSIANSIQKDRSEQAAVAYDQELRKSGYVSGQKAKPKDGDGCAGWAGVAPVFPLNGTWPLLYNMGWINSSFPASGGAIPPSSALTDTGTGDTWVGAQASPSIAGLPSAWSSAWNMSLRAAAAAIAAAAATSENSAELATMPVLGKHPRSDSAPEGKKAGSLWAPKSQRITGPGEAERSSFMAILGAAKKPESITTGSMFKAFQRKQTSQCDKHPANYLNANPAAMTRSTAFQESN
ncbi:hypothetical protein O6H91_19G043000 [Diphasiastrum complanatum]|uniref:Uncharacterized protein n=1 Tax=Diphasiastrum complanatum TaxID=34168 RepID=A0ACC2AUK7_DIPCM|nr:hypothetical protein O6H91_19G043000 [Diphasiastrum complanatum]